jgi:hypothetical protein
MKALSLALIIWLSSFADAGSQATDLSDLTMAPDLSEIANADGWQVHNRQAEARDDNGEVSVYFEARPGDGAAWLEGFDFSDGTIEVDIKGKDAPRRSFVGIAFRGIDEETYDAIYFRPFNFQSKDPLRKGHSVQYISHPDHPWHKLRQDHPEEYENPINSPPDPEAFFHARIVIEKRTVSVFVNDSKEPCLVVTELSDRTGGRIGLWMGNNSDGTFSNLSVTRASEQEDD